MIKLQKVDNFFLLLPHSSHQVINILSHDKNLFWCTFAWLFRWSLRKLQLQMRCWLLSTRKPRKMRRKNQNPHHHHHHHHLSLSKFRMLLLLPHLTSWYILVSKIWMRVMELVSEYCCVSQLYFQDISSTNPDATNLDEKNSLALAIVPVGRLTKKMLRIMQDQRWNLIYPIYNLIFFCSRFNNQRWILQWLWCVKRDHRLGVSACECSKLQWRSDC